MSDWSLVKELWEKVPNIRVTQYVHWKCAEWHERFGSFKFEKLSEIKKIRRNPSWAQIQVVAIFGKCFLNNDPIKVTHLERIGKKMKVRHKKSILHGTVPPLAIGSTMPLIRWIGKWIKILKKRVTILALQKNFKRFTFFCLTRILGTEESWYQKIYSWIQVMFFWIVFQDAIVPDKTKTSQSRKFFSSAVIYH